jgi:uncharacterized protein involved in oxidation of intracellular sulfur
MTVEPRWLDPSTEGPKVPQGFYNVEVMVRVITRRNGLVGLCGTCMNARGIAAEELSDGCHRSSMEKLAGWTANSERVLVF